MSEPVKIVPVRRYDAPEQMAKPELQPNGWLRCEAVLTKTGVFKYRNADGTERRELRLPQNVFASESMKSFHLVPVTDDHPEVGWLDASNTGAHQKGSVDMPVKDGERMRAKLLITDAGLIAKVMNREKTQVSNGYFADLEMRSGEYEGETFDAIQTNIRGNHVAIVDEARAGPEARIKLDSADAVMVPNDRQALTPGETAIMAKIRIDSVDFEIPEQTLAAVQRKLDERKEKIREKDGQIEQLTAENGQLKGRADALVAECKKRDDTIKTLKDPKAVAAAVNARVALVSAAREILGAEFKADEMTDRQVKEAVIAKAQPKLKLDGKSDDYVSGQFDVVVAKDAEGNSALDAVRQEIHGDDGDGKPAASKPAGTAKKDARDEFIERSQGAWKNPLPATAKRNAK